MRDFGYISEEQRAAAEGEKLEFKRLSQSVVAPHLLYIKELLAEKYGEEMAERGVVSK